MNSPESSTNIPTGSVGLPDILSELQGQIQRLHENQNRLVGNVGVLQCIDLLAQTWSFWAIRENAVTQEGIEILRKAFKAIPNDSMYKDRIKKILTSCTSLK